MVRGEKRSRGKVGPRAGLIERGKEEHTESLRKKNENMEIKEMKGEKEVGSGEGRRRPIRQKAGQNFCLACVRLHPSNTEKEEK